MKKVKLALCPMMGAAIVVTTLGMSGCSGDGAGSAPTPAPKEARKSNKDEIQKATQSGIPYKGNVPGPPGKKR
jgi:hypothetical protein